MGCGVSIYHVRSHEVFHDNSDEGLHSTGSKEVLLCLRKAHEPKPTLAIKAAVQQWYDECSLIFPVLPSSCTQKPHFPAFLQSGRATWLVLVNVWQVQGQRIHFQGGALRAMPSFPPHPDHCGRRAMIFYSPDHWAACYMQDSLPGEFSRAWGDLEWSRTKFSMS